MKRITKLAVGLVTAATMAVSMAGLATISANAYQVSQSNATFVWYRGYASMKNNATTARYACALVEVYNNVTGVRIDWDQQTGNIGFNESVAASSTYRSGNYSWTSRGYINSGPSSYAPTSWDVSYNP